MMINTQYNIGEKVWVVKPNFSSGIVEVFDSRISSINIKADSVTYYLEDIDGDYTDANLQPYDRDITAYVKLCMNEIRDRENTRRAVQEINNMAMKVTLGGVKFE